MQDDVHLLKELKAIKKRLEKKIKEYPDLKMFKDDLDIANCRIEHLTKSIKEHKNGY
jgi:hypothetical protein